MSEAPTPEALHGIDPRKVTWAALLGRWVEFARTAVVLPQDQAGRRWRAAVPDVIMLQAVWFALKEVDELPADQRALGLDRAAVLFARHAESLETLWKPDPLPEAVGELVDDVRRELARHAL